LIFRKQSCFNVNALQQQRTGSVLSNLLIGQWCIRRSFRDQMAQIKDEGWQFMSAPTLIGETGISWDFDDDPRQQPVPMRAELWQNPAPSHLVLDNTLQALDWNVMSYTLWNYNPSNRGRYQGGDEWNGEDFSIYTSEHDNTRFLVAVRPYPVHAFGEVLWMEFHPFDSSMKFKMALRVHDECRRDSKDPATTTVLFVPKQVHYRNGVDVSVSVSAREIQQKMSYSIHDEEQLYHFCFHQPGEYFIELKRR
jgi:hypothetical protein